MINYNKKITWLNNIKINKKLRAMAVVVLKSKKKIVNYKYLLICKIKNKSPSKIFVIVKKLNVWNNIVIAFVKESIAMNNVIVRIAQITLQIN